MKQLIVFLCLSLSLIIASAQSQANSPFAGMSGREIIETIRTDWRPTKTVTSSSDISGVMAEYARLPKGSYRDYFSSQSVASISQLKALAVVPLTWWGENTAEYNLVKNDLHNIVPANAASSKRSDYPPGEVTDATYDNGYWKSGIGTINGIETNFYEPADELKGDFARIYMYMVAAYP
ncbi:MAG: endonuclease, partial [Muribaculaceae bacterium]|nr:endonuclease [Muribaculaceae bacterium]